VGIIPSTAHFIFRPRCLSKRSPFYLGTVILDYRNCLLTLRNSYYSVYPLTFSFSFTLILNFPFSSYFF
jgi:hypothetical protein